MLSDGSLDEHSTGSANAARQIIDNCWQEEKGSYRTRVDDVTLFGVFKAEDRAKQRILRDDVDTKIKEIKALNTMRPSSSHRILRAATQKVQNINRQDTFRKAQRLGSTKNF